MNKSESKQNFANTLSDYVFIGMNQCERYGMTFGCDIDCPVLRAGKCELRDSDNKELYEKFKSLGEDYEDDQDSWSGGFAENN